MVRLTPFEMDLLTRMLTSHTYREKLAAERFNDALTLLPSQDLKTYWLHVIEEEEEHYAGCLEVARQLDIDLEPLVHSRMQRLPAGIPEFHNWLDVLLAHAFNDKAGYYVLLGLTKSKVAPYAKLAESILVEEESHGASGAEALIEYYPSHGKSEAVRRKILIKHLDAAVRCLGRPQTKGDQEAVKAGLKTKSASETISGFCLYADQILKHLKCDSLIPTSARYLK